MQHLMLDLYGCRMELLENPEHLFKTLAEYPSIIDMEAAIPPVIKDITTNNPLDDGLSGFIIIFTSHISFHAWPPYKMLNLDIFSCKSFDEQKAIAFAQMMFDPKDIEIHSVERATRSPRDALLLASTTQVL